MTSALQKINSQSRISSEQVASYLHENPDFFHDHLELLEVLSIPHPSGKAVSLIAKQLQVFRNKHLELEGQLASLIDIARANDASASHMHQLTLSMLDAHSLEDLLANLEQVLFDCFLTDFVAVRILQDYRESPISNLFLSTDDPAIDEFLHIIAHNQPKCGRPTLAQAKLLFGDDALRIKSSAIIPMAFTELEGILAIGSFEDGRFHATMGHMFLTQISEIVGTRLIALLPSSDDLLMMTE